MEAFKNLLLHNYYTVFMFLNKSFSVYLETVLSQQLNTVLIKHYIYKYQALTEYTTLILGSSSSIQVDG